MRTNKACPFYEKNNESVPSMNVAMTEEEEGEIEKLIVEDDDELVKIDGTKMQLSGKLLKVTYLNDTLGRYRNLTQRTINIMTSFSTRMKLSAGHFSSKFRKTPLQVQVK